MGDPPIQAGIFTRVARGQAISVGRIARVEEGTLDGVAVEEAVMNYVFNTMKHEPGYEWLGAYDAAPSSDAQLAQSVKETSKSAKPLAPLPLNGVLSWWKNPAVLASIQEVKGMPPINAKFDSKRSPAAVSDYEMGLRRLQRGEIKYSSLRPPLDDMHLPTPELRELDALVLDLQDLDKRPVSAARNSIRAKKLAALTMLQTKSPNTHQKA